MATKAQLLAEIAQLRSAASPRNIADDSRLVTVGCSGWNETASGKFFPCNTTSRISVAQAKAGFKCPTHAKKGK